MDILVNVVNQKLKVATNQKTFVAGTQEFIRFVFEFSNDWTNLKTFVQFQQNDKSYNVYLDEENAAYLPPEIVSGILTIALQGNLRTTIAKSQPLTFAVDIDPIKSDSNGTEITLSLYDQLAGSITKLEESIKAWYAKPLKIFSSGIFENGKIFDVDLLPEEGSEVLVSIADTDLLPNVGVSNAKKTKFVVKSIFIDDIQYKYVGNAFIANDMIGGEFLNTGEDFLIVSKVGNNTSSTLTTFEGTRSFIIEVMNNAETLFEDYEVDFVATFDFTEPPNEGDLIRIIEDGVAYEGKLLKTVMADDSEGWEQEVLAVVFENEHSFGLWIEIGTTTATFVNGDSLPHTYSVYKFEKNELPEDYLPVPDDTLNLGSARPIQNKVVARALAEQKAAYDTKMLELEQEDAANAKALEEHKMMYNAKVTEIDTRIDEEIARAKAAEKANSDAIEILTNGVSREQIDGVVDLVKYTEEHGAEVTEMKANISANAEALNTYVLEVDYADTGLEFDTNSVVPEGTSEAELDFEESTATSGDLLALINGVVKKQKFSVGNEKYSAIMRDSGMRATVQTPAAGNSGAYQIANRIYVDTKVGGSTSISISAGEKQAVTFSCTGHEGTRTDVPRGLYNGTGVYVLYSNSSSTIEIITEKDEVVTVNGKFVLLSATPHSTTNGGIRVCALYYNSIVDAGWKTAYTVLGKTMTFKAPSGASLMVQYHQSSPFRAPFPT